MRTPLLGCLTLSLSAPLVAQRPSPESDWMITVGAMALTTPKYPGSNEYRILPFPGFNVTYRERFYLGPSASGLGFALGAYAIRTSQISVALELGGQDSRPALRADALAGLEDRDAVLTAGAGLTWRAGPIGGSVAVSRGVNDGAGVLGTTRLWISRNLGRAFLTLGTGVAVADANQMRREFGVTSGEADRRQELIDSGDPRLEPDDGSAYQPDAALRHVGVALSLGYPISRRWSLMGFGGVEWLGNEAAASPLVRRREQFLGGIGLWYRL